jgi:hypothetical protein
LIAVLLTIALGGEERTVFRTGRITMEDEPAGNFSLMLPDGWRATEYMNLDGVLTGSITNGKVTMQFWDTSGRAIYIWDNTDGDTVTEDIEGASVHTYSVPSDPSDPHSSRVASFNGYPGGPLGIGGGTWFETRDDDVAGAWDTFIDIARSLRYEPPPTVDIPVIAPPDPSWVRRDLRTGLASTANFSVMMPEHWTIVEKIGIDSLVGSMEGDGIKLGYDFGMEGIVSYSQFSEGRHKVWPVTVRGETGYFNRPVEGLTGDELITGAYFGRLPGNDGGKRDRAIELAAFNLNRDQQDTVLSVIATIEDAELTIQR